MRQRTMIALSALLLPVTMTACDVYESMMSREKAAPPAQPNILERHDRAIDIVHAIVDDTPRTVPELDADEAVREALRKFLDARRQAHGQKMLTARLELLQARAQVELYRLANRGKAPSFESIPWEIVSHGFMNHTPANPLSPEAVARRVLIVETTGLDGSDVDPRRAGWVWNATDHRLFLAGMTDEQLLAASHSALHAAEPDDVEPILVSKLQSIREQLESYQSSHGSKPNLADEGWTPLTNRRLLSEIPLNPLSPYETASRVVAGRSGLDVDPTVAGWVWNESNQMLYAAGFDDRERLMHE